MTVIGFTTANGKDYSCNPKGQTITFTAENKSIISIADCKNAVSILTNAGFNFEMVYIHINSSKQARYFVNKNCLQIRQDGVLIYENNNGLICNDIDALADNL